MFLPAPFLVPVQGINLWLECSGAVHPLALSKACTVHACAQIVENGDVHFAFKSNACHFSVGPYDLSQRCVDAINPHGHPVANIGKTQACPQLASAF